MSETIIS